MQLKDEKELSHGEYLERLRSGRLLLMQELNAWRQQCGISDEDLKHSAEQLLSSDDVSASARSIAVQGDSDLPQHLINELSHQQQLWKQLTFEQLLALIVAPLTW